jgi:hypothetical protein
MLAQDQTRLAKSRGAKLPQVGRADEDSASMSGMSSQRRQEHAHDVAARLSGRKSVIVRIDAADSDSIRGSFDIISLEKDHAVLALSYAFNSDIFGIAAEAIESNSGTFWMLRVAKDHDVFEIVWWSNSVRRAID